MKYITCAAFDVSKVNGFVEERVGSSVETLDLPSVAIWDCSVVVVDLVEGCDAVSQVVVVKSVNLALEVALTWNEWIGDAVLVGDVALAIPGWAKSRLSYQILVVHAGTQITIENEDLLAWCIELELVLVHEVTEALRLHVIDVKCGYQA